MGHITLPPTANTPTLSHTYPHPLALVSHLTPLTHTPWPMPFTLTTPAPAPAPATSNQTGNRQKGKKQGKQGNKTPQKEKTGTLN